MNNREIEDIYPLSPMQQGMLFHSIYAPETAVYLEQLNCRILGSLDTGAFQRAWQEVVARHTILRTSFMWEELDEPLQIVHRQVDIPLITHDFTKISQAEQDHALSELLEEDLKTSFDLIEAPLMRLTLAKLTSNSYFFIWTHHHLLLDGWSMPILLKEVFSLYETYSQGANIYLRPARPYRDYIGWIKQQDLNRAETFWRQYLKGFSEPNPLTIISHTPEQKEDVAIEKLPFDEELSVLLRKMTQQMGVTLNTIFQGAWGLLLSRYCQEDDIVFGATVSGRPPSLPGIDSMLGLFINTLPVRLHLDNAHTVKEWLKALQMQQAETRQYEYSPLVQIQNWSEIPPGQSLFESILVFENYPVEESLKEQRGSLQIRDVHHYGKTNYPLTVVIAPGSIVEVHLVYNPSLFGQEAIHRLLVHLKQILSNLLADGDQLLGQVKMLTVEEENQLLSLWNFRPTDKQSSDEIALASSDENALSSKVSVVSIFERQAVLTPYAPAIVLTNDGDTESTLTYQDLNIRVDELAQKLRQLGVGTEFLVGICLERSAEMIIALLAVLKAGGAYVPLDPKYPAERLAYMLDDAGIRLLITQSPLYTEMRQTLASHLEGIRVICLDQDQSPEPVGQSTISEIENLTSAAYVIYTSGSTGQPKGVVIPHQALSNHAVKMAEALELDHQSRLVQLISLSFDAAGEEIFPTLISGGTLFLPHPEFEISGVRILEYLEKHKISVLHLPVPLWNTLVDEVENFPHRMPTDLRVVLVGGESPSIERLSAWAAAAVGPMKFINAYGPTEATITTAFFKMTIEPGRNPASDNAVLLSGRQVPIGKPIPNAQIFILDREFRPVPVGVPGEIFIGGAGLARGYLNRPELTSQKFIMNPFSSTTLPGLEAEKSKLYRTGDLGVFLPDGNILFSGRVDNQVKLRGYRIELEEIESVLVRAPGVKDGVVVLREDRPGDKYLVAYVEFSAIDLVDINSVRRFITNHLPEYMAPAWYVVTDALPRLPNGKIDRRAVARWDSPVDSSLANTSFLPPRDAVEEIIAGLWVEVLSIDFPGIHANFFELGGHSLKATQLLSRIRQTFSIELPLRSLFDAPTIAGMAEKVRSAISGQEEQIQPIHSVPRDPDTGVPLSEPPLSFSQQRLWFLDQLDPGNLSYNIPAAVLITGNFNLDVLEQSLNRIIQRHESLRTVFTVRPQGPVQHILPELTIQIAKSREIIDGFQDGATIIGQDGSMPAEIIQWLSDQVQIPFDLSSGPLIRAALKQIGEQNHILVVTIHHIVSDGWSMGILIRELVETYASLVIEGAGAPSAGLLPSVELQYADYSTWQREWLSGDELDRQMTYWKERLQGAPPLLELPTDRPRPAVKTSRGDLISYTLPDELSSEIQSIARLEGVTVYMFLLAAFQTLLARYSGQDDICVGSAIANRTRPEVQGMIGFFVNTLVLRTDLTGDPGFREVLQRVRDIALGAYAHQDLPFEMLVEALQPERNLSYTPLFQVGFDLQEVPIQEYDIIGIRLNPLSAHAGTAAFDMLMSVNQSPGRLSGSLEFNTDLFDRETIERFLGHFNNLLISIVANLDQPVSKLTLLSESELNQILIDWNTTLQPYSSNHLIHQLFEEHARQHPNRTALNFYQYEERGTQPTFSSQILSYVELNEKANLLARLLVLRGVGADVLVGISTERSIEMIIGILGILKAGGAYLPLDPNYPAERLGFMLDDSQVRIILSQDSVLQRMGRLFDGYEVINLDSGWEESAARLVADGNHINLVGDPSGNLHRNLDPQNLAYMIYTSGSTGKPKGALLQHRGLCNLVEWQQRTFEIDQNSRVLQFAPLSFDASVWETFMALANGAALCLASQDILANGIDLVWLMKQAEITTVTLPPSVLSVIPENLASHESLPHLRTVIAAGETCSREIVSHWAPGRRFFDAYGPTETTVCASAALVDPQDPRDPPIGRSIANFHLYIVDQYLQPVPIGIPGELLIGGVGLARGYHARPELTAEKFIANPVAAFLHKAGLSDRAKERLYRTGDLVRYRKDGNIEYLGRIDQQVKLRGFRIELGEIESVLRQYRQNVPITKDPDAGSTVAGELRIRDVAVVVREDTSGDRRMVAFIVPELYSNSLEAGFQELWQVIENQESVDAGIISNIRKHLRHSLPEYMLPSGFVFLDSLPLSPSGKIDRKSLETRFIEATGREQSGAVYESPRNETDLQLCKICADLLGLEWNSERSPIGIRDNFFDLGGHSLMATQFISRVRDQFQIEIPLRTLFEHPTVAELSEKVDELKQAGIGRQAPIIQPVSREARRMRQTSAGFKNVSGSQVPSDKQFPPADSKNDELSNGSE